jgi:hypothetical protein
LRDSFGKRFQSNIVCHLNDDGSVLSDGRSQSKRLAVGGVGNSLASSIALRESDYESVKVAWRNGDTLR